ncbi:acyltransferase family protein [Kordiimonas sp.]|uniref:acyltransferase family protein n=1 Tax=Kordiimonas sp. TaxID=1970157 RepID=UPI003A93ABFC
MRLLELDGLRAVAVMMVFVAHSGVALPGGGLGVDIFFAISGYIITRLLLGEIDKTGTISIRKFYKKRIVRLWPALFALLLCFLIIEIFFRTFFGEWDSRGLLAIGVVAVSALNYVRALELGSGGILGHTWSLAVEEQFYLIWPAALLALGKISLKRAVFLLLFAAALIALWRAWLGMTGSWWYAYHALETRADGLIFGALLAMIGAHKFHRFVPLWPLPFAYIAFLSINGFGWDSAFMLLGGHSLVAISSAWLVCACVLPNSPFRVTLGSKVATWIGDRSYSLYLWHYPVLAFVNDTDLPSWITFCLGLVASVVISDISIRFIEHPIRKRFSPNDQHSMQRTFLRHEA